MCFWEFRKVRETFRCCCSSEGRKELKVNPRCIPQEDVQVRRKEQQVRTVSRVPLPVTVILWIRGKSSDLQQRWVGQKLLPPLVTPAQQTRWSGHWALTRKPREPGKELVWTYSANRQQTGKSFEGYGKCSRGQWSEIQNATTLYYGKLNVNT